MFEKLKLFQKLVLITLLYLVVILLEYWIHSICLKTNIKLLELVLTLIECCVLMLTGFFYFQTFKYHRLWKTYYRKRKFETTSYFKFLLVPVFQFILINSFMRHINPRVYLKGRKRDYIKILYEETKQSETAHIISLIVTAPIQVNYLVSDRIFCFLTLSLFSIFFSVYPILLQRMNRFLLESRLNNLLNGK